MMINMIKNVIFDFDGTIADVTELFWEIAQTLSKEFNVDLGNNAGDYKSIFIKYKNMPIKTIKSKLNIKNKHVPKILKRGKEEYEKYLSNVVMFDDMENVIRELKHADFKIGICSSNSIKNIKRVLKKENFDAFAFIYSEKKVFGKHKKLKKIIKKEKLKREETIYIGDEVRDIEAAKKARIKSGAVTWGLNGKEILKKASPNYLFNKPKDISKKLGV